MLQCVQKDEDNDGVELCVHQLILMLSSSVLQGALSSRPSTTVLKVDRGSRSTWLAILKHLYPLYPRPQLTVEAAVDMLPVVHQYDFKTVQAELMGFLSTKFPSGLTAAPGSPCSVIRWLSLADNLQLDALRAMCMQKIRDMAFKNQLDATVLIQTQIVAREVRQLHIPGYQNVPGLETCVRGHVNCTDMRWCAVEKSWKCCKDVNLTQLISGYFRCGSCSGPLILPGTKRLRYFQNDNIALQDSITQLSRGALEELSSVVAIHSGGYSNTARS